MDKPLRLPLQDVYKIGGIGTVPVGRVETGVIKPGMVCTFAPGQIRLRSSPSRCTTSRCPEAVPGDNVGFNVKNVSVKDIRRGNVCGDSKKDPPKVVHLLRAGHHPEPPRPDLVGLLPGPRLPHGPRRVQVQEHRPEDGPAGIRQGARGDREVREDGQEPVHGHARAAGTPCVESFAEYPPLGRFAVRDMRQTVAVGVIKSVDRRREGGQDDEIARPSGDLLWHG